MTLDEAFTAHTLTLSKEVEENSNPKLENVAPFDSFALNFKE